MAEKKITDERDVIALFNRIDDDGDGTIDQNDLAKVLQALDPEMWPDDMVQQLLSQIDSDEDGRVSVDDFVFWAFASDTGKSLVDAFGAAEGCESSTAESAQAEPNVKLPPFMLHDRRNDEVPRTSLRVYPRDTKEYKPQSAYNGEVVEIRGVQGKYANVKLALQGTSGWLHLRHLHPCAEGTAFDRAEARKNVKRVEFMPSDGRLKEIRRFLRRRNTTREAGDIRAEKVWLLTGHYLGEAGLRGGGIKETMFCGVKDSWVDAIADGGFDDCIGHMKGDLGQGAAHFTPSSCKAFTSSENYMFICEVALGSQEERMTVEVPYPTLTAAELQSRGKLSVQCHGGKRFVHEERAVFDPAMCKPVYLLKLESPGFYGYGGRIT